MGDQGIDHALQVGGLGDGAAADESVFARHAVSGQHLGHAGKQGQVGLVWPFG